MTTIIEIIESRIAGEKSNCSFTYLPDGNDPQPPVTLKEIRADLVADFARAVPTRLISKILGLPPEDYARITNWSYQFISALEPFISLYQLGKYNRHAREFYQYVSGIIEFVE